MSSIKRTMGRAIARNRKERRVRLLEEIDDVWLKELMLFPGVAEVKRCADNVVEIRKINDHYYEAYIDWSTRHAKWTLGNSPGAGVHFSTFGQLQEYLKDWIQGDDSSIPTPYTISYWTGRKRRKGSKRTAPRRR